jgi:dTDP-4-amino-4,6-dideoxygalactose transaminase
MIPFVDLQGQYRAIRSEIDQAVHSVLDSGHYVLGEAVEQFERDFAQFCGSRHAVALNSGTSALHLALLAAAVGPGDEVITSPATFVATVSAILYAGATPVLVDIDPASATIDPDRIAAAITPRTRAIMPVHLHGQMADMAAILTLAAPRGIRVIEDAAQAHGAEYRGRRAGSIGDIGCFSFYPSKNLGACGEGGALVSDDDEVVATARSLRDWGQAGRYNHVRLGYNYRMDALQGAILGVKLNHLRDWTERRQAHAALYHRLLRNTDLIGLPPIIPDRRHVHHVFAVALTGRADVQLRLADAGIGTAIHYPAPVHCQPAFHHLGYRRGDCPVAEAFCAATLSLPMFPELTSRQIEQVCHALIAEIARARAA